jgi:hypothetical protein
MYHILPYLLTQAVKPECHIIGCMINSKVIAILLKMGFELAK